LGLKLGLAVGLGGAGGPVRPQKEIWRFRAFDQSEVDVVKIRCYKMSVNSPSVNSLSVIRLSVIRLSVNRLSVIRLLVNCPRAQ
jgi:hypothetical protein